MSDSVSLGSGSLGFEHTTDAQGRRVMRVTEGLETARVQPNGQPSPGPIGNTQGIIVPDTEPNPNGHSAPPIEATPEEAGWWGRWGSAVTHGVLDVVGLIPVVGEIADGANALIYLAEGDTANAALSAAAMVPGAGMAVTGAKLGKRAAGAVAEGAAKTGGREATQAAGKEAGQEAAEQGARRSNGRGGGKDKGKKSGQKGRCGEKLAKQDLMQEGFDEVIEVQNNSGHGVDLIGRNSKTGEVKVWEVKTTEGTRAPSLSDAQSSMGGADYTADRLRKAAAGRGNYGKVPEAMENAEKALDWIGNAEKNGKPVTYEKREVFIDDIMKGCAKSPNMPSRSKPWPAKN